MLSVYLGRYRIQSKFVQIINNKVKELQSDTSTTPYYCESTQNQYKLSQIPLANTDIQLDPLDEFGSIYIGYEDNQIELKMDDIIMFIIQSNLSTIVGKIEKLDVVFETFKEEPQLIQCVQKQLGEFLKDKVHNIQIDHISKEQIARQKGTKIIQLLQNCSIYDQQQVKQGSNQIKDIVIAKAKQQFSPALFKNAIFSLINDLQQIIYATSSFNVVVSIPNEIIVNLKKMKLLNELLTHKNSKSFFSIKARSISEFEFIISRECLIKVQEEFTIKLIDALKIDNYKVEQIAKGKLPILGKPVIYLYEEGHETLNPQVFKQIMEKIPQFKIQMLSYSEIVEESLILLKNSLKSGLRLAQEVNQQENPNGKLINSNLINSASDVNENYPQEQQVIQVSRNEDPVDEKHAISAVPNEQNEDKKENQENEQKTESKQKPAENDSIFKKDESPKQDANDQHVSDNVEQNNEIQEDKGENNKENQEEADQEQGEQGEEGEEVELDWSALEQMLQKKEDNPYQIPDFETIKSLFEDFHECGKLDLKSDEVISEISSKFQKEINMDIIEVVLTILDFDPRVTNEQFAQFVYLVLNCTIEDENLLHFLSVDTNFQGQISVEQAINQVRDVKKVEMDDEEIGKLFEGEDVAFEAFEAAVAAAQ